MEQLYSLRKNFAIIGLTGRSGAGCSTIAGKLSDPNYIKNLSLKTKTNEDTTSTDRLKFNICIKFLSFENNFEHFHAINYSHVLFYQMLYESFHYQKSKAEALTFLIDIVFPKAEHNTARNHFSDFEKGQKDSYLDGGTFLQKIKSIAKDRNLSKELEGRNYKKQLQQIKESFADWYLKLYLKHRISEKDHTQKIALLDSDAKAICDILKDADFLSSGQYMQWLNKINKLQPADMKVNKSLILTAPYQDFSPADFEGAELLNVNQLKSDLEELLEQWTDALKDTLDDPMVKKKMNLLDDATQKLLADFKSRIIDLAKDNALQIRNAIMDLHKGLEKVELSIENMKTTFNKPLTPDEAIEAFKAYIDQIAQGKERDKIRIILK